MPSNLISWTHSRPRGAVARTDGRQGSTNPTGSSAGLRGVLYSIAWPCRILWPSKGVTLAPAHPSALRIEVALERLMRRTRNIGTLPEGTMQSRAFVIEHFEPSPLDL